MSKSIKLKNDTYISDESVIHNRETLKNIIDNLDTSITNISNKLNTLENYSTTEQVIGTWINGKPLYRKVYTITIGNSGTKTIQADNSNIYYVRMESLVTNGRDLYHTNRDKVGNYSIVCTFDDSCKIKFITYVNNYNGYIGIAIMYYYKTTD